MHFQFRTFSELKITRKYNFYTQLHELHTFGMIATPITSLEYYS